MIWSSWTLLRTPRFYIWFLVFVTLGILLKVLPQEHQASLCSWYETRLKSRVLAGFVWAVNNNDKASVGSTSAPANIPSNVMTSDVISDSDNSLANDLESIVHGLFCEQSTDESNAGPATPMQSAMQITMGAGALAFLVCLFIPARPTQKEAREQVVEGQIRGVVRQGVTGENFKGWYWIIRCWRFGLRNSECCSFMRLQVARPRS